MDYGSKQDAKAHTKDMDSFNKFCEMQDIAKDVCIRLTNYTDETDLKTIMDAFKKVIKMGAVASGETKK